MNYLDLGEHPGYYGVFTRNQVEGAYPNGSTIKKVAQYPGDGTPLGTYGTVLGSVTSPEDGLAYFVEWQTKPGCAVLVTAKKIGTKDAALEGFLYPGGSYDPNDLEVGKAVLRVMAGNIKMPLKITELSDTLVTCGAWTFDRATGEEIDEDLNWGPLQGFTGSLLWTKWDEE